MTVLDTVEPRRFEPSKNPLPSKNTDILLIKIDKIVLIFARAQKKVNKKHKIIFNV
jgi:hypothetical protein